MSYVNGLLPVVDVDRKPFVFPVSEIAAAVYEGPSSSVEIGPASSHSPFVAASPPSAWHPQSQSKRSWYLDPPVVDQTDCKIRPSFGGRGLPSSVPEAVSPRVAKPSYGHRTPDTSGVTSGLFLSHSSNGLNSIVKHETSLPASCYFSNAGMSHHLCLFY